jgi:hypothetical protein
MSMEILLSDKDYAKLVNDLGDSQASIYLIKKTEIRLRGADPVIIVAAISAISGALNVVLMGLLNLAKAVQAQNIVLQTKDGTRIEVPVDYPEKELDKLIEKIKTMEADKVYLQ